MPGMKWVEDGECWHYDWFGRWLGKVARRISEQVYHRLKCYRTMWRAWTSVFFMGDASSDSAFGSGLSLSAGVWIIQCILPFSFSFMKAFGFYLCFLWQLFHFTDRCDVILQQAAALFILWRLFSSTSFHFNQCLSIQMMSSLKIT